MNLAQRLPSRRFPAILPDEYKPAQSATICRPPLADCSFDTYILQPAKFAADLRKRQAAMALAMAAGCWRVVACHDTKRCTGRRRTASHKARACGTLAPHGGEQAAEGQTARWRLATLPGCQPPCLLAPDLARMRSA